MSKQKQNNDMSFLDLLVFQLNCLDLDSMIPRGFKGRIIITTVFLELLL